MSGPPQGGGFFLTHTIYIYILLDTVLATDIIKYSPASARCQPIWRTHLANWIYF